MARKKKKNTGPFLGIPLFAGKTPKRRTRAQRDEDAKKRRLTIAVSVSILLCTLAAVGFVLLEGYVNTSLPVASRTGPLQIIDPPYWYNDHLARMIMVAAGGSEFEIAPGTAKSIGEKLSSIEWLKNIQVRTLKDHIEVRVDFRKPVALIQVSGTAYYLDSEPVEGSNDVVVHVLDYIPIGKLPIIEVTGLASNIIPSAGSRVEAEDVVEAVKLISLLHKADLVYGLAQPLVNEIAQIDVSNYGGRKYRFKSSQPHIVLIAHDGTEVQWGAAVNQSARYFEATENEKLAQLYAFYKMHGTIQAKSNNIVKWIDLRVPQNQVPRP